jgi:hypothetical protein
MMRQILIGMKIIRNHLKAERGNRKVASVATICHPKQNKG